MLLNLVKAVRGEVVSESAAVDKAQIVTLLKVESRRSCMSCRAGEAFKTAENPEIVKCSECGPVINMQMKLNQSQSMLYC